MKLIYSLFAALVLFGSAASCSWWEKENASNSQTYKHAAMKSDTLDLTIQSSSGKLAAILEIPNLAKDTRCPIVLLMHGLTSQKNDPLNVRIANTLKERGIASIRFDFNGHGGSDGKFKDMTVSNEYQDALAVYNYVRSLNYISDVGIAGHSQGGLVCSMLAGNLQDKISAMVLMSAAANIPDMAKKGNILGVKFDPDSLPEEGITLWRHNIGKAYLEDAQLLEPFTIASNYDGPVCIMHGTKDSAVPVSTARQYQAIFNDPEVHIFEGDNHGFGENFDEVCIIAADFFQKQFQFPKQDKQQSIQ